VASAPGEMKHTFQKSGKFIVALSVINSPTQEKIPVAEAKALITGSSQAGGESDENAPNTKFHFIAKDPFEVGQLPEDVPLIKNEGSENRPIHGNHQSKIIFTITSMPHQL